MKTSVSFRSSLLRGMRRVSVLFLAALLLCSPALVGAAAGGLDLTFGTEGKTTTDFFAFSDRITAIAIQPNGKIVGVGSAATGPGNTTGSPLSIAIARYNSDGSLDGLFGSGGKVVLGSFGIGEATAVAIQSDGKIVLAGFAPGVGNDFVLARLNTDGSLDSSFGVAGKVLTDFFGGGDGARGVAIQADGRIVAAGTASTGTSGLDFAVARYDSNGILDSTFGSGGKVNVDFFGGGDIANALAIQADGQLLVAGDAFVGSGSNSVDFGLVRFNTNGTLDSTFGAGGRVNTDFFANNDTARGIALQSNGSIVVAGSAFNGSTTQFGLARYNSTGALDGSFGAGGKVTTSFSGTTSDAAAVAIQANGKIVAAGRTVASVNSVFAIARYSNDGSLDPAFGAGGKVTTDFAGNVDEASGVALQLDGKVVAAGRTGDANTFDFAVARYQTDGPSFEGCLQDESTRGVLQFNSTTGDYQFTDCQGLTIAGTATVSPRGCAVTLQHNSSDRRVLIRVDTCRKTGTASIQLFSPSKTFTITDRDTANNACLCPAP